MSETFYTGLKRIKRFADVFGSDAYAEVPEDWWIAITDVVGSTRAIEAGRYKDVNAAGSLATVAISNHLGGMDFPFFFGGDGMVSLVPPDSGDAVRDILAGTKQTVQAAFNLDLRVALIPVGYVKQQGKTLRLARWEVSPQYAQAILDGDGFDYAETLLKSPGCAFLVPDDRKPILHPDFTGYTCRWQDFPSAQGETVAMVIRFRRKDPALVSSVIDCIGQLIGREEDHHPLRVEDHRPILDTKGLAAETTVITGSSKGLFAFFYRQSIRLQVLGALAAGALGIPLWIGKKNIARIKQDNVASSDFRKFDNTLKMVVSIRPESRQALEAYLEDERASGTVFFGLHVTNRAMITCLLHMGTGHEVHFVDAANGGYAIAAKMLKAQMRSDEPPGVLDSQSATGRNQY